MTRSCQYGALSSHDSLDKFVAVAVNGPLRWKGSRKNNGPPGNQGTHRLGGPFMGFGARIVTDSLPMVGALKHYRPVRLSRCSRSFRLARCLMALSPHVTRSLMMVLSYWMGSLPVHGTLMLTGLVRSIWCSSLG